MNDPSAEKIKHDRTRAQRLEEPLPQPSSPPAPEPTSESARVERELNERLDRYKRGDR
jgi:hypothetical protein